MIFSPSPVRCRKPDEGLPAGLSGRSNPPIVPPRVLTDMAEGENSYKWNPETGEEV